MQKGHHSVILLQEISVILRDRSIIRGWGAGADRGWVSKFYARIKGGTTKIYVGVLTIFLKTKLKYHQINN